VGIDSNWLSDGPYAQQDNVYDVWGNTLSRTGWGGMNPQYGASYTNNKMNGMTYDNSGNLTDAGGGWIFTYDATGQQATSAMGNVQMYYDGDRLRGKKSENGVVTYYLRSSVLGGQVVAELSGGTWTRGYVYFGGEILAVQQSGVHWMHQDPVAKSKRVTNGSGAVVSTIELDPWGGETNRSSSEAFQPRKFTTYEQDSIGSHEAMNRRYNRWWARFEQPDPYGGSYDLGDPQSFNRYSYVQNDPVSFVDPSGLRPCVPGEVSADCNRSGYGWGWGDIVNNPGMRPGLGIILAGEELFDRSLRRYHDHFWSRWLEGIGTRWLSDFLGSPWSGFIPQDTSGTQPLSDCVKNLLATYFDRGLLNSIRVHPNGLPSFVPKGKMAYTSGADVYYAQGKYDPNSARGIAIMGHEVAHSEQYRQNGNLRFKAKYLFSSLVAGIGVTAGSRGSVIPRFDSERAYYGNRFEKEAERREQQILDNLNQQFGSNNPCP
jgi:RHS repeat-associated protein